jgi:uncharacterized protein (TIGR00369 family)
MSTRIELDPLTFGSEQVCYGCGPHNDRGLRLKFFRQGDEVVTSFTPTSGLDGPPGILHGGLQATLADEVAGWALVGLLGRMGFTTSMSVRYMRPIRIGQPVEARARIISQKESVVTLRVVLKQEGRIGCRVQICYGLPTVEAAEKTLEQPLSPAWLHLFDTETEDESKQ